MRKLKEVVVVEGRYDKNTLSQVVDAVIIETSGFGIFNDREKRRLLVMLAEARGLIVLTDSDGAGFVIRNYIKSCVDPRYVKHAYIPEIYGKEKRKRKGSREGWLGVEGMSPDILLKALERAGACFLDAEGGTDTAAPITKADMFRMGLSGCTGSAQKREKLLRSMELPLKMSADALLDVLNATMSREEFYKIQL